MSINNTYVNNKFINTIQKNSKTYCSVLDIMRALGGTSGQTNFSSKGYRYSVSAHSTNCSMTIEVHVINAKVTTKRYIKAEEPAKGYNKLPEYNLKDSFWIQREDSNWRGNSSVGLDLMTEMTEFCAKVRECGFVVEITEDIVPWKDKYVTLSQLKNDSVKWSFREIISYDLKTSIPTFKDSSNGRKIIQTDVDEINRILERYSINTPNRICHFLAQCHAETNAGLLPIERYDKDPLTDQRFKDYETGDLAIELGNTESGDGHKYRGAGAIQITGRGVYASFSEYVPDGIILDDGALYVGQKYFWETAGYYWSIYKPSTANNDLFDLNKKCDENASVETITRIVNGGTNKLSERQAAYDYYKTVIK